MRAVNDENIQELAVQSAETLALIRSRFSALPVISEVARQLLPAFRPGVLAAARKLLDEKFGLSTFENKKIRDITKRLAALARDSKFPKASIDAFVAILRNELVEIDMAAVELIERIETRLAPRQMRPERDPQLVFEGVS